MIHVPFSSTSKSNQGTLVVLLWVHVLTVTGLFGQDVFRDFHFIPEGTHFSELDPNTKREWPEDDIFHNMPRQVPRTLKVDLKDAIRAEMSFAYWGGHVGTSDQRVLINDALWVDLPQPVGTPGNPQCYYRTLWGNNAVPVPIEAFNDGENVFRFSAGPQICHDFDWGMYWIYGFTVRIYYSDTVSHPSGTIRAEPTRDGALKIEANVSPGTSKIARVDFIGDYDDFDWDGDGIWKEWQYQLRYGKLEQHLGSRTRVPWKLTWSDKWIPEQDGPIRIRAIITDESGLSFLTEPITIDMPKDDKRVVKAYRSKDIPEKFGVRNDHLKFCTFQLPDDLSQVKAARLVISSWSADSDSREDPAMLYMNKTCIAKNIGVHHEYSLDTLKIPVSTLKPGENRLYMYSNYIGHALEINWPGPQLLLEFKR